MPVVVTEEEPERKQGQTAQAVAAAAACRHGQARRPTFDLSACPSILADVTRHDRATVVLAAINDDRGSSSPRSGLDVGRASSSSRTLSPRRGRRMRRSHGCPAPESNLIGLKGLGYEWLRTVERATDFAATAERDSPAGIVLFDGLSDGLADYRAGAPWPLRPRGPLAARTSRASPGGGPRRQLTSSTARSNASPFACDGLLKPLILRTYWRAALRNSSSVRRRLEVVERVNVSAHAPTRPQTKDAMPAQGCFRGAFCTGRA